jgi:hypothetical protein
LQSVEGEASSLWMESSPERVLQPVVLILMGDQWPRALLRAELLEAGYDAVGARSFEEGLALVKAAPERGPVRLVVIDQDSVAGTEAARREHDELGAGVLQILLAKTGVASPPGNWDRVVRRPVSIGDIVRTIRTMLPLTVTGTGS